MLLEGPFVLKPSPSQQDKVRIVYTRREMPPRVKRRLYGGFPPPLPSGPVAIICKPSSSLSSDGLPLIKRRRRIPPTPLHRDHVVEDSIAQAFIPPTQDYRKKAEFWQGISRKQKQQILNLEMDARQLRRRLWELEEQVVWWASSARGHVLAGEGQGDDDNAEGELAQPYSATSEEAQPISPSTNQTEKPPLYIITQPRKCCFYLTDGEGLSEDDYDDNDEECEHCCDDDEEENQEATKENASSGGNNTGAAQLFRVKKESRDDDVVE